MKTAIQAKPRRHDDRTPRWDRTRRAELFDQSRDLHAQGLSLRQAAQARDQDTWPALMEQALSGLNCHIMQATSDEAPALLAYVEHHLGAHHSPDLFHVQHALVKAVSGPMATKQRAAGKAATEAQERLAQVQGHL